MNAMKGTSSGLRELVRRRRLELQWSQREAAERAGVSVGTWQSLEREQPSGGFQELTLSRVAQALDIPLEDLLAAAGRAWLQTDVPRDEPAGGEEDTSLDQLVEDITADLRRLGRHSKQDLLIVHSFVREFTEHLLRRG